MDTDTIKKEALQKIEDAKTLAELEGIYRVFLGRKGKISDILGTFSSLSSSKRASLGKKVNNLKRVLEDAFEKRESTIREKEKREDTKDQFDVTAPGYRLRRGSIHPLSRAIREIRTIFASMGFEVASGPEIETEFHNFDALNIPAYHPARDLHDTFWLESRIDANKHIDRHRENIRGNPREDQRGSALLLRTHTSPVQIRYMETHQPPFRIIAPGKCFRHEATDASHEFQFYQVEGLLVGEDISLAHLKGVLEEFFKRFFRKDVKTRFRPGYFPFVEPGVEVEISCLTCNGRGCSVCGRRGWLEMLGAGMVHPNVFKAVGYGTNEWQGFAFGVGIDRLAMMKYKINDVRLFHNGDLRFINQF